MSESFNPQQSLAWLLEMRRLERSTDTHPVFNEVLGATLNKSLAQVEQFRSASNGVLETQEFRRCLMTAIQQDVGSEFVEAFAESLRKSSASFGQGNASSPLDRAAVEAHLLGPNLFAEQIDALGSEMSQARIKAISRPLRDLDTLSQPAQDEIVDRVVGVLKEVLNINQRTAFIRASFANTGLLGPLFEKSATQGLSEVEEAYLQKQARLPDGAVPSMSRDFGTNPCAFMTAGLAKSLVESETGLLPSRPTAKGPSA